MGHGPRPMGKGDHIFALNHIQDIKFLDLQVPENESQGTILALCNICVCVHFVFVRYRA